MLIVESISKIRRYYFVEGMAIREISRKLNISRNTVRKVIRSGALEHRYERERRPLPALGEYVDRLEDLLKQDKNQSGKRRITAKRMYDLLQADGYGGSYDAVQRYAKRWREQEGESAGRAFIPLRFDPGDAYQFDWSHEWVILDGVVQKVKVAHFRLCHSRHFFVAAYPRESEEMVFDAHDRAFAYFGGTCRRGIYDNMSTAVSKVLQGRERVFNRRFLKLCSHYLVEPVACTPGSGWEKGQVERQVKLVRDWLFTPRPRFGSFEELNAWLADQCMAISSKRRHPENKSRTIWEVFQEESAHLIGMTVPFNGYSERECRVSGTSLVHYDRNQYSVDCRAAGQTVTIRASATMIRMVRNGEIVAEHVRRFGRDKTVYDPWHYLDALERKPGGLRDGAPFKNWPLPRSLRKMQRLLLSRPGGDREFVDILNAARDYGLDLAEQGCTAALTAGAIRSEVVLNCIARAKDPAPAEPVAAPTGLRLREEPAADCGRYDSLLNEVCHGG